MAYAARVVADSLSATGVRLVTVEATYPRFVHSELMTHRMFSRNASSNRALTTDQVIRQIEADPVIPIFWGKRARTMSAANEVSDIETARDFWLMARDDAIKHALGLKDLGLHKQLVNRILEPFQWITVVITATEWENFFKLRCHEAAQPEIRHVAEMMLGAIEASNTVERAWHLPYVTDAELDGTTLDRLIPYSVARCARVSYLQHDGAYDPERDLDLYRRLTSEAPAHASPLEHVALQVAPWGGSDGRYYNLSDWMSWRYLTERLDCTLDELKTRHAA